MLSIFKKKSNSMPVQEITMPDHARIWIYQADRKLTDSEMEKIKVLGDAFVSQWQTHGKSLASSFAIEHQQFLIIAVDEEQVAASGCSIDASVGFIKSIEEQFSLDLMDKMKIAYRDTNNNIEIIPLSEFQDQLSSGMLNAETIVFNNLVNCWGDLKSNWEVAVKNSWHKQLI